MPFPIIDMSKINPIPNPHHNLFPPVMTSAPAHADNSPDERANGFIRCPLPGALTSGDDNLRQFYSFPVPQYRIIPPNPLTNVSNFSFSPTTTATAGVITAPNTVAGYLAINIGGTIQKIPFYNS